MSRRTGLCQHCGEPYAPLTADGYIDRHYRADHERTDPGNQICAGSAMGGGHLRPGEPCRHTVPSPSCRSGAAAGGTTRARFATDPCVAGRHTDCRGAEDGGPIYPGDVYVCVCTCHTAAGGEGDRRRRCDRCGAMVWPDHTVVVVCPCGHLRLEPTGAAAGGEGGT